MKLSVAEVMACVEITPDDVAAVVAGCNRKEFFEIRQKFVTGKR